MKLIELVNSVEALNKLSETKISAGASFSISKLLKDATSDLESYHKVKNEKVKEYGSPVLDDKGEPTETFSFSLPGTKELTESGKKFVEEMDVIENRELDITIPEITVKDLGDAMIEPKYLVALSWLIKE